MFVAPTTQTRASTPRDDQSMWTRVILRLDSFSLTSDPSVHQNAGLVQADASKAPSRADIKHPQLRRKTRKRQRPLQPQLSPDVSMDDLCVMGITPGCSLLQKRKLFTVHEAPVRLAKTIEKTCTIHHRHSPSSRMPSAGNTLFSTTSVDQRSILRQRSTH